MKSYLDSVGAVVPSASGARQMKDVFAAMLPPPSRIGDDAPPSVALVKQEPKVDMKKAVVSVAPAILGGAAGAYLWDDHRVLGFLAGHAVAANVRPLIQGSGEDRKRAMCRLGVDGAGIAGSLLWADHPVIGWFLGIAAGTVASTFIPGSPAQREWAKWKESK